jgi:Uma2 family endonuclease
MSDVLVKPRPAMLADSFPLPPTQDDLPCDDGMPMESQRHYSQMSLLIECMERHLAQQDHGFTAGNMFVYFSAAQLRGQDFRGPDFFVVLDVPKGERKSWVVWEEGKGPDVVIELLLESSRDRDKQEKKQVYQNQIRVPEYFWFDPFNPQDFAGFVLRDGIYQTLAPDEHGRLHSGRMDLALTLWHGVFRNIETDWLRWATPDGVVLPTYAEFQQQRAEEAAQRVNQQAEQAARLAAKLRELGVNPEDV